MNARLKIQVLLVEDNPTDVLLLQEALTDISHTEFILTSVERLSEALTKLATQKFDVILLDLGLPDSSGADTFIKLRQAGPNVPVLVLTGTDNEALGTKAMQEGAQDYLIKNQLQSSLLGRSIRYAIERHRINTELDLRINKLAESEARIRKIIEANADAVVVVDANNIVQFTNPAAEKLFGYSTPALISQPFAQITDKEQVQEITINLDNGQTVIAEMKVVETVWNDAPAYLASLRDITQRKQMEEALRLSEEKFARAFRSSPVALSITRISDKKLVEINESFEKLSGYSAAEAIGHTSLELGLRYDKDEVEQLFRKIVGDGHIYEEEASLRNKKGDFLKVVFSSEVILLEQEPCLLSMILDVTERKRAQEQLQRFVSLSPTVLYALNIEDSQYHYAWISENSQNLTGYKADEYVSIDWWQNHIHLEDRERILKTFAELTTKKHTVLQYRFQKSDGNYIWLRDEQKLLFDEQGKPSEIIGVLADITELVKLEEQFRQAQKMEAIGQLSGGIAHDFNNILFIIQGHISLLELRKLVSHEIAGALEEIKSACNRAANLTRQLLTFSRCQVVEMCELDLNEVVAQMNKMLQRILGEHIEMQYTYATRPLNIYADAGMMDQILLNLAVNARDAMSYGGQLHIKTSYMTLDEQSSSVIPNARPGAFACLTVIDKGCGISSEDIEHIFEPFFTTKDVGKGTGLGLATVFGIVQQHQGWITVISEVGKGTTFHIYLPIYTDKPKELEPAPVEEYAESGTETILIIEDEPALRTMLGMFLADMGYNVLEAANGMSALEIWKSQGSEISLVITDLVMPGGLSGLDVAQRLLQENPQIKFIYTSGYSAELVNRNIFLREKDVFLAKPYDPIKLAQSIRACLDV